MTGGDAPPATASGPGVPYAEWPAQLGDPRWHRDDHERGGGAKTRAEIVAHYRRRRPEDHEPVSAKAQRIRAQEVERKIFPVRLCSFQAQCHRARATRKCHHCIQFDPLKLGFYCDACFEARHPAYRVAHTWTSLEVEVDPEQSWMTHLAYHNLEQDARELQLLLTQTQSFLSAHGSPAKSVLSPSWPTTRARPPPPTDPLSKMRTANGDLDFQRVRESVTRIASTLKGLVEQVHAELAAPGPMTREQALVKIQAMWRVRRARKQMRALIQSVYQAFTDPTTGQTYYYNARTKETKWTKPRALGSAELPGETSSNQERDDSNDSKREPSELLQQLRSGDKVTRREVAAACLQRMARAHSARRHIRVLVSSVYEKIWDAASDRFYYHNTRTDRVSWTRPRWVSDGELPTPRTRDAAQEEAARQRQRDELTKLRAGLTLDGAASMVQRAFRRRRGFRALLELCRSVYERIYDAEAGQYYYHNTRTREVTWEKPRLLRNAQADVFSPRSREAHARARLEAAMHRPREKREWTPEQAAARLQALYRARCARRALDAQLAQQYKKVWDPASERFYYANLATGAVSWDVPALLQRRAGVALEEIR